MSSPDVYVMPLAQGAKVPAGGQPGVSQPEFIIRDGNDYWVPLAMVHYAADDKDQTGINTVRERMEAAIASGEVVVAVRGPTMKMAMASDQSTG